ncbi:sulfurtransferase-like selenium metabolism protein YedF [Campylobacter sp. FMV-PI01]|uniref:Sulfurtransferase-like selenium metabolism protein YedF n=1 Tax=Campylobacter portucalensis TaxID=2608384 RepID=A0A6L5WGF2_9BACT|nr:sulfurtransferase-like selenium metabolism protein YedF [Campylobacter portucalensis]MSN95866.1 sulfurtransferase-like selenium metabolism protein YedF [Campylobacter portucalensis]
MKVDCRNLECPEPIIKVKDAIKSAKIGQDLEVVVNSLAPKENISRFLKSNDFEFSVEQDEDLTIFRLVKNHNLKDENVENYQCQINSKVIYLNEDRAGSGDVGVNLLGKFLGAVLNLENKPKMIICVNNAVFMTANRSHPNYAILKNLEENGIEIYSCGSCLEAYKIVDKLSIGKITNAYDIMDIFSKYEVIKL